MVHRPGFLDPADFFRIRDKISTIAPEIDVFIVANTISIFRRKKEGGGKSDLAVLTDSTKEVPATARQDLLWPYHTQA